MTNSERRLNAESMLASLKANGTISDWVVASSAGRLVWSVRFGAHWENLTTREVEAFLTGITLGQPEPSSSALEDLLGI